MVKTHCNCFLIDIEPPLQDQVGVIGVAPTLWLSLIVRHTEKNTEIMRRYTGVIFEFKSNPNLTALYEDSISYIDNMFNNEPNHTLGAQLCEIPRLNRDNKLFSKNT